MTLVVTMKQIRNEPDWRANGMRSLLLSLEQVAFELKQLHPDDVRELIKLSGVFGAPDRINKFIKAARKIERALRRAIPKRTPRRVTNPRVLAYLSGEKRR